MGEVTLRAVTFNARHGLGLDGCQDLSRTAALLRWLAPDLAGLQELDEGSGRSGGIDQAAWLGRELGMHVATAPARGRRPHERVAVLSVHPIAEVRAVWFWNGGRRGEPRGAVVADVAIRTHRVRCTVAHLSTRPWQRVRERRALATMIAQLDGPLIAFLDANGTHLEPLRRTAALRRPPGPAPATFPASHPAAATDWVLTRAPIRHLSQAWAPPSQVSDHLPVLVTVGW
jgi:endonuclease/exonuclease/phosphatase family metal-dependent hydrolase